MDGWMNGWIEGCVDNCMNDFCAEAGEVERVRREVRDLEGERLKSEAMRQEVERQLKRVAQKTSKFEEV